MQEFHFYQTATIKLRLIFRLMISNICC